MKTQTEWIKEQGNTLYFIEKNEPITREMVEEMKNYTKILFGFRFNQKIKKKIPHGITHLYFEVSFYTYHTRKHDEYLLPFPNKFNRQLINLPSTITDIHFINLRNKITKEEWDDEEDEDEKKILFNTHLNVLPESVVNFTFGPHFNHPVSSYKFSNHIILSPHFTNLSFGAFNKPIGYKNLLQCNCSILPEKITHLEFNRFNQQLFCEHNVSLLPRNLIHLNLGRNFNQPICNKLDKKVLPDSIIYLFLGEEFDEFIGNIDGESFLPRNLLDIDLGRKFDKPIGSNGKSFLPEGISKLDFDYYFNQPIENYIPKGVTSIKFGNFFNQQICTTDGKPSLPDGLIYLEFGCAFNRPICNDTTFFLPNSIQILKFGKNFNNFIPHFPRNLKEIHFGSSFNQPVDNLPLGVEKIFFGSQFNQPVDNLPNSITHLNFGHNFNQPIDNLPRGGKRYDERKGVFVETCLIHLTLGDNFNQSVDNLPHGIKYVYFGKNFNQDINNLVDSIEEIYFCYFSKYNREVKKLPANLKKIKLPKNNKNEQ